jgi:hypothetical protein
MESERTLYMALTRMGERYQHVSESPGVSGGGGQLTPFELRVFSQNGEDGILAEILARVGFGEGYFVEFGAESGREGNCVYLADVANWRGLFMDSDAEAFSALQRKYRASDRVHTDHAMVTPANVQQLFAAAGVPREPALLSIDIDGSDYWVWEAIADYVPRVLVIEYNSALDPRRRLVQPADLKDGWDGTEYFGASLGAMRALGERKGYRLVHTELSGVNAFFVREDLAEGRFPPVDDVPLRGAPNYFQYGQRHAPDLDGRSYLDLDSGEMVRVEHPADAPLPAKDTVSAWRERALSAEEHLERSRHDAADAGLAYEVARKDYANAMSALDTSEAERSEMMRRAAKDLAELRAHMTELEAQLGASRASLVQVKSSLSWRITAPLRALGGMRRNP